VSQREKPMRRQRDIAFLGCRRNRRLAALGLFPFVPHVQPLRAEHLGQIAHVAVEYDRIDTLDAMGVRDIRCLRTCDAAPDSARENQTRKQ
jgi:hypothetical protein